ncbi:hypothetical protein [Frankia tisae]|uniref:hypothetical protein n=1 Tax=Frankia tisae TaxID=2950104 RepID=UPI0021C196FF|nr:hypothetical protein [Frankia tisae]
MGGPATASPVEEFRQRPAVAEFVAVFRTTFPELAEGRSDEAIASDVTQVCLDDLRDPSTGQPAPDGEAAALRHIPSRFRRHGITPDTVTARMILSFARGTACSSVHVVEDAGGNTHPAAGATA